jgi:hypothetical protein
MNRLIIFMAGLFILLGGVFASVGGYFAYDLAAFIKKAATTQGVIVGFQKSRDSEHSDSYYFVVEFDAPTGERIRFKTDTSTNMPMHRKGEAVTVYFDPQNPKKAKLRSPITWIPFTFFFIIGSIFFVLGLGFLIYLSRRRKNAAYLRQFGRKVEAHGVKVVGGYLRVGTKNSYRIACRWLDPMTGKERALKSDLLWFDPGDQLKSDTIDVFIDMANAKKYWVDTSFLNDPTKGKIFLGF